jgi:hypothetical protein
MTKQQSPHANNRANRCRLIGGRDLARNGRLVAGPDRHLAGRIARHQHPSIIGHMQRRDGMVVLL